MAIMAVNQQGPDREELLFCSAGDQRAEGTGIFGRWDEFLAHVMLDPLAEVEDLRRYFSYCSVQLLISRYERHESLHLFIGIKRPAIKVDNEYTGWPPTFDDIEKMLHGQSSFLLLWFLDEELLIGLK